MSYAIPRLNVARDGRSSYSVFDDLRPDIPVTARALLDQSRALGARGGRPQPVTVAEVINTPDGMKSTTILAHSATLGARVTAEASARATADGYLEGKYTLTVTAGNVVTGMNITSASGAGSNVSDVTFVAANFKIYNGTTGVTMFEVSGSNVALAGTLVTSTSGKVYIGTGTYGATNTSFYVDSSGQFSLKDKLTWNGTTLAISGSVTATAGTVGGWTLGSTTLTGGNATLDSTGVLTLGTTTDVVILSATDATYRIWVGNTAGASAAFSVTKAGALTASSATIAGTISGRATTTIASTINSAGNVVTDLINARLDSSAKTMLSGFTFGTADYSGALSSGTITWNTTTGALTGGSGVLVYRGGIIGAAAGVAKFTLDAATGAATFAGALSAPTGTLGGWTINASTITGTNTTLDSAGVLTLGTSNDVVISSAADATYRLWVGHATAASAPFRVTKAGALTATSATITGTVTATAGAIGGFDVGSDYIRDTVNSFGMASTVTAGDDVRFWAGATFTNRATAPFRLTEAGALTVTSATVTGTVTATTGAIAGFTLSSTEMTASSGTSKVLLASDTTGKSRGGALILGDTTGYRTIYSNLGMYMEYNADGSSPDILLAYGSSGADSGGRLCLRHVSDTSSIDLTGYNGNGSFTGTLDVGTGGYKVSGTKVVGVQGSAIADITLAGVSYSGEAASIEAKFDAILAMLRTHGLIAT